MTAQEQIEKLRAEQTQCLNKYDETGDTRYLDAAMALAKQKSALRLEIVKSEAERTVNSHSSIVIRN